MYQEYPKAMVHPNYQPAVVDMTNPKAAVFPPVTVMNEDQEEYHKSLGYTSTKGDPSAHLPDVPNGYVPQEYPKFIGETLVNSAEEEAALTGEPVKDDRAALRAEYERVIGKKPFAGWSAEVLKEKLEGAKVSA